MVQIITLTPMICVTMDDKSHVINKRKWNLSSPSELSWKVSLSRSPYLPRRAQKNKEHFHYDSNASLLYFNQPQNAHVLIRFASLLGWYKRHKTSYRCLYVCLQIILDTRSTLSNFMWPLVQYNVATLKLLLDRILIPWVLFKAHLQHSIFLH